MTESPLFPSPSVPVDAATALVRPPGMPVAAPKTTSAWPAPSDVPDAKVCRRLVLSEIVQPERSAALPPEFTTSTNSPAMSLPGSLARISLRNTAGGELAGVMVNAPLLVSVAPEVPVSLTRPRALVVDAEGPTQVKLPAEAVTLAAATLQLVPSSVYSTFTLLSPEDVQVMAWLLPDTQLSPPFGEVTVTEATTSQGTRKSFTTPMCCMFTAPLSPASAGLISEIGEYTRVSATSPLVKLEAPITVLVCFELSPELTSTQSYGLARAALVLVLPLRSAGRGAEVTTTLESRLRQLSEVLPVLKSPPMATQSPCGTLDWMNETSDCASRSRSVVLVVSRWTLIAQRLTGPGRSIFATSKSRLVTRGSSHSKQATIG